MRLGNQSAPAKLGHSSQQRDRKKVILPGISQKPCESLRERGIFIGNSVESHCFHKNRLPTQRSILTYIRRVIAMAPLLEQ